MLSIPYTRQYLRKSYNGVKLPKGYGIVDIINI